MSFFLARVRLELQVPSRTTPKCIQEVSKCDWLVIADVVPKYGVRLAGDCSCSDVGVARCYLSIAFCAAGWGATLAKRMNVLSGQGPS